jgi:uncharacterized protein YjbI with pentapeptide repeats
MKQVCLFVVVLLALACGGGTNSSAIKDNRSTLIETRKCRYCDLRGVDLQGENLDDVDLTGALLRNSDFSGASLNNARLPNTDLTEAEFDNAYIRNTDFSNADLERADFTGASFKDTANFSGANTELATGL